MPKTFHRATSEEIDDETTEIVWPIMVLVEPRRREEREAPCLLVSLRADRLARFAWRFSGQRYLM